MISLRHATYSDLRFLWHLHVAAMRKYVEATFGWDPVDQGRRFESTFKPELIIIIEANGEPVGMWESDQEADPWFLGRVVLCPKHQRKGIGSSLIRDFLDEADQHQRVVRLQVLKVNPAKALYEKFGFVVHEETETHYKMERAPIPREPI